LDEIFMERDKNQTGKITYEQLEDIFRIYQVELDDKTISKVTDDKGEVSKDDFVKIALENKLLDFGNVMSGSDPIKSVQKKSSSSKHSSSLYTPGQEISSGKHSLLCCLTRAESEDQDRGEDRKHNDINHERLDRVEQAFRRFDLDQDGFLSWTEFKQVKRGTSKMLMKCCFEKNYCLLHEIN